MKRFKIGLVGLAFVLITATTFATKPPLGDNTPCSDPSASVCQGGTTICCYNIVNGQKVFVDYNP